MEDGLVLPREITNGKYNLVLILVVVEDGLVLMAKKENRCCGNCVLILVVVEDGLVPA